jgi:hypothetical protein
MLAAIFFLDFRLSLRVLMKLSIRLSRGELPRGEFL